MGAQRTETQFTAFWKVVREGFKEEADFVLSWKDCKATWVEMRRKRGPRGGGKAPGALGNGRWSRVHWR